MDFEKKCDYWPPPLNVETTNNNVFFWFIVFSNQFFRISLMKRIYLGNIILRLVFFTQKAKCAEVMRVSQFGTNFSSDVAIWMQHTQYPREKMLITYMILEENWMLMTLSKAQFLLFHVCAKWTCEYFS